MIRGALSILLLFLSLHCSAQEEEDTLKHSPRTATLRSALLPGLGQAYNEKYWKIPVIYGGLAASVYFIDRNGGSYRRYRQALIDRHDPNRTDPFEGIYTEQQLNSLKDTYRRWRDYSYIGLIAVYVLQVVDANVDAHLYDFDVGDDLSLRMRPWSGGGAASGIRTSSGVSLSLHF